MKQRIPVILIADADATATRKLRVALRRGGAVVLQADSLRQALERAARFHPEVIVLDDGLAGEGVDIATLFANAHPEAEIVLLCPNSAEIPRGSGLGLLFSGHKPVATNTLYEIIHSALEGRLKEAAPGEREPLSDRGAERPPGAPVTRPDALVNTTA